MFSLSDVMVYLVFGLDAWVRCRRRVFLSPLPLLLETPVIQVDIGGHPPIPLGAPPLSLLVFQFRHNLLFLAVFQVLNFWSCSEALNDVFWENGEQHPWVHGPMLLVPNF